MSRTSIVISLLLAGVALLGATAATAQIVSFNFPINVEQELPAPNLDGLNVNPSGTGMVTLDTSTNELNWEINYQDLSGPIVAPGAHFHGPAAPGATAGIQVFISDGDPEEPATGMLSGSATLDDEQEADLLAGLWYVNIHTGRNQPGEIRGQVIPEPSSILLVFAGAVIAFLTLRHKIE